MIFRNEKRRGLYALPIIWRNLGGCDWLK